MNLIVGTAGHIDHGKTALVRALTGVDTDRLPEEKQRGITIDLGFAELNLGDLKISFIDVPGHERFVRNMLAGAGGIDIVMLVVAADEGVMPQTREHFDICRLLGTRTGIVVLTKSDLIDDEMLELAKLDVAALTENSFLENAKTVIVSSKTGEGIDELRAAIGDDARRLPKRSSVFVSRLPIDRSFTVKGFGAVVTGTLMSGSIDAGAELELLPAGRRVRVRGVQTQGRSVEKAVAGQRTALNLGGIDHSEVSRGMVLANAGVIEPTRVVDTFLEVVDTVSRPVRSRQRVRMHIGADEVLARVHVLNEQGELPPGEKGFVQLRLERPAVGLPGDRFIVRSYSPQATIAGGEIVDAQAVRHRRRDLEHVTAFLDDLLRSAPNPAGRCRLFIGQAGENGIEIEKLRAKTGYTSKVVEDALADLSGGGRVVQFDGRAVAADAFRRLKQRAVDLIRLAHAKDPLAGGVSRETMRDRAFAFVDQKVFEKVVADLQAGGLVVAENGVLKFPGQTSELSAGQQRVLEYLRQIFRSDNYEVPKIDDALRSVSEITRTDLAQTRKIFQILVRSDEVVKVSSDLYFARGAIDALAAKLRDRASLVADRLIDVPAFKNMAGLSRKYAIPILEYFDSNRITTRQGDKRRVN